MLLGHGAGLARCLSCVGQAILTRGGSSASPTKMASSRAADQGASHQRREPSCAFEARARRLACYFRKSMPQLRQIRVGRIRAGRIRAHARGSRFETAQRRSSRSVRARRPRIESRASRVPCTCRSARRSTPQTSVSDQRPYPQMSDRSAACRCTGCSSACIASGSVWSAFASVASVHSSAIDASRRRVSSAASMRSSARRGRRGTSCDRSTATPACRSSPRAAAARSCPCPRRSLRRPLRSRRARSRLSTRPARRAAHARASSAATRGRRLQMLGDGGVVVLCRAARTRRAPSRPFPSASSRGRAARRSRRPDRARSRDRCRRRAGAIRNAARSSSGSSLFRYCWFSHDSFSRSKRAADLLTSATSNSCDHLLAREDFLVAVRPAQAHEVVEQRVRQEAVVAVLHDADRAVALGELLPVRRRGSSAGARTPAPLRRARGRC